MVVSPLTAPPPPFVICTDCAAGMLPCVASNASESAESCSDAAELGSCTTSVTPSCCAALVMPGADTVTVALYVPAGNVPRVALSVSVDGALDWSSDTPSQPLR